MELQNIITKLKAAFQREDVKKEILDQEWFIRNIDSKIDCTGFCYVASAVIYVLTGADNTWTIMRIKGNSEWGKIHGGHCYLKNKQTGEILDITEDQYRLRDIEIPLGSPLNSFGKTTFSDSILKKANKLSYLSGLVEV
jgi:hypothetical protein